MNDTANKTNLDLALHLASLGWLVFPCNGDKKPIFPTAHPEGDPLRNKCTGECGKEGHGFHDGTTDPVKIRDWWKRWPGELVGIYCEGSNLFVVDIDVKDGINGFKNWGNLVETCGHAARVEYGPCQNTPSGGRHILFKYPTDLKVPNNTKILGPNLDLRSAGYICTGGPYTWIDGHGPDTSLTAAPSWLLDLIRKMRQPKTPKSDYKPASYKSSDNVSWAAGLLERLDPWRCDNYSEWVNVGISLSEVGGPGLQLWEDWSKRSKKYKPGDCADKWETFKPGNGLTLGSLYFWAEQDDSQPTNHNNGYHPQNMQSVQEVEETTQPAIIKNTELGNARRFVRQFQGQALHVQAWGWMFWNGRRWEIDETGRTVNLAKQIVDQLFHLVRDADKEAAQIAEQAKNTHEEEKYKELTGRHDKAQNEAKKLLAFALKCQTAHHIAAILTLAESDMPARVDDFDANPWLLNVENGTLNLRTGQLQPHDPKNRITKIAGAAYDPAAECLLWIKFLSRVMDQELINFLQKAIGYSLTGQTVEQCLFFLYGTGKNGKTVFSEILLALLADYARKTPTDTLMIKRMDGGIPNDIARLPGARVVIAAELAEGKRLNESLVKDLTGGDRITARFLHREFFEFSPTFKLWMYGNHKPMIRGTDEGIWRRVRMVPFTVTIPAEEQDPNMTETLKAELSGILAWAVRGCLEWQKDGLKAPEAVLKATSDYRAEQDLLAAFLEECCLIGPKYEVTAGELYTAFKTWAVESGENVKPQRWFSQTLAERGYKTGSRQPGTGRMIYMGLGLVTQKTTEV